MYRARMTGRPVAIALIAGLGVLGLGLTLALSRSPPQVIRTNSIAPDYLLGTATTDGAGLCQAGELLPAGTSAIRFSLETVIAPAMSVKVLSGEQTLTSGRIAAGWMAGSGEAITLRALPEAHANVTVCFTLGQLRGENVGILGETTPAARAASGVAPNGGRSRLRGRIEIDYLRHGRQQWGSRASEIVRRMGLGRAWGGAWVALLVLVSTLAAGALALWWTTRASRADGNGGSSWRMPTGAWVCAAVAILSAVGWSFLSPPFQVVDEPDHFAYAQWLAESSRLPVSTAPAVYSEEEMLGLRDLQHYVVRRQPQNGTISSAFDRHRLQQDLERRAARRNGGFAGTATSEPPLYYALQTIPYRLGASGTILERLQLMRLLSALLAGATALFAFLFVREALPGTPWAWSVGGLGVALQPLLGELSGAVNPDALLYALAAALFYCLARAFRRGPTPLLALATGATTAAGCLTKLNFLGLLPGLVLALALLAARALRSIAPTSANAEHGAVKSRKQHSDWRVLVGAMMVAALPIGLYALLGGLSHGAIDLVSGSVRESGGLASPAGELSYLWQLYLPRLPGMSNDFPGILTTRTIWLDGLVGLYGWIDTTFPRWVYQLALLPIGLITALCLRTLLTERAALRRRVGELAVYALMGAGVLALVGGASYVYFLNQRGPFLQVRYMFPLLALLGAVLALAARGAGTRWGPVVGALIVVLVFAHDLFSQLLVAARYYG
ncbi:MAG TPA: DUF2142 domain-containing protein [Solirubrobacteraceae bacterium]|nr:DUF2142 domain-containing protein [Solirubrobacteraceae bacterium]